MKTRFIQSLRWRLILSHLAPFLIIVPLTAVALLFILQSRIELNMFAEALSQQAVEISEVASGERTAASQSVVAAVAIDASGLTLAQAINDEEVIVSSQPIDYGRIANGGEQTFILYLPVGSQDGSAVSVQDIDNEIAVISQVSEGIEIVSGDFGQVSRIVLIVLGVELAIGLILGFVLALRLEKPLGQVTDTVIGIARGDDVPAITISRTDEVGVLIDAVNTLSTRLRDLEENRKRLLANVVHEIGRPLGAMRSAVHVLRQGGDEDQSIRTEMLAGLEGEILRLEPLLDDLTRLHGRLIGRLELNLTPVDPAAWLTDLLGPWQAAAQHKGLVWEQHIASYLPTSLIDQNQLGQAIGNLLSNAIKYTPKGSSVSISAMAANDYIVIDIRDTGVGIPPEEIEMIFDPFYRGRRIQRFSKGLGLGLTIARDIIHAHGGSLSVNSRLNEGTTFRIMFAE